MISDKALYMLAIGVLAAGVGQRYAGESPDWVRCAMNELQQVTRQASSQAMVYFGNNPPALDREVRMNERVELAAARVQARIDREQSLIDLRSAQVATATAALRRIDARMADVNVQAVEIPQPNVRVHCRSEE